MYDKPTMLLLVGLPASGKSTFAQQLVDPKRIRTMELERPWFVVNWDTLRRQNPLWNPNKFSRKLEEEIQEQSFQLARDKVKAGYNLVIDNTNLSTKTRLRWEHLGHELGLRIEVKYFTTPLAECIERDAKREPDKRVGRAVIERMALWNGLVKFDPDKKLVLVDVDGTLADITHRRHFVYERCSACEGKGGIGPQAYMGCPRCQCSGNALQGKKDWKGFFARIEDDKPVEAVVKWVQALYADPNYTVCIVSGRDTATCGDRTVAWLEKHGIKYDHLFMRAGGDRRPDFEVKQEILDRLPKNQIAFCIDDRNQVVEMWRKNGLTVYQVADGDF